MCFDGSLMFDILREIGNENAAHEYYLTDAVAIAVPADLNAAWSNARRKKSPAPTPVRNWRCLSNI